MNSFARIALAAVAVVVVAVVGMNLLPRSGGFGAAPTPSPSPTPTPIVLPDTADLEPGTTYYIEQADVTPARFTLTVPAGWETISYAILGKTDGGAKGPRGFRAAFSTWLVANVWVDPCKSVTGGWALPDGAAPTVDSLANALSQQVGRNGSEPADVTSAAFRAKRSSSRSRTISIRASARAATSRCGWGPGPWRGRWLHLRTWPAQYGVHPRCQRHAVGHRHDVPADRYRRPTRPNSRPSSTRFVSSPRARRRRRASHSSLDR